MKVRPRGLEPLHPKILDPKSNAATNYATGAFRCSADNSAVCKISKKKQTAQAPPPLCIFAGRVAAVVAVLAVVGSLPGVATLLSVELDR